MVKFICSACGFSKDVADTYAGKNVRCPKCKAANVVANEPIPVSAKLAEVIKFYCPHCKQKIGVKSEYAGRQVKCAHCKNPITIPNASEPQPTAVKPPSAPPPSIPPQESFGDMFGNAGDLLALEKQGMAMEKPQPAEAEMQESPVAAVYARPQTDKKKISTKTWIITAAVAVFVMAIIAVVVSTVGSLKAIKESGVVPQALNNEANDFALKCIAGLASGDVNKVAAMLTPELQVDETKIQLSQIADSLQKTSKGEYVGMARSIIVESQGTIYGFDYELPPANEYELSVFVRQKGNDIFIEGITLSFNQGEKLPIVVQSELCRQATPKSAASFLGAIFGVVIFLIVIVIVIIITIISQAMVFRKAGEPAWAVIVPVYNMWVLARIGDRPGFIAIAAVLVGGIPFIGGIISIALMIYICIGVAATFSRGILFALGLCFLPFVFYPILAFSEN